MTKNLVISRILVTLGVLVILAFVFAAFAPEPGSRRAASESLAASSLRAIDSANAAYASEHPQQGYARKLSDLAGHPRAGGGEDPGWTIDPVLAAGQKGGYKFTYSAQSTKSDGRLDAFQVRADPLVPGKTGNYHFFVDQTGVFRASKDGPADSSSDVLQ